MYGWHVFQQSVYIVIILLLCVGCTNRAPTKPVSFNQAVTAIDFQNAFQNRVVKLIAPASGTEPAIINQLKTMPYLKVSVPEDLITNDIIFHSNNDVNRFSHLKTVLENTENNTVIWTLRGGYGSARLIDYLKKCPKPKTEKFFIGSSDVTALHLFLSQQWGWRTIHGVGLANILDPNQDPQNFERIATIISKSQKTLTMGPLIPLNDAACRTKKLSGRITGGNLTMLQTSIGTPWQIQTAGKILFLEEVGEKGYKIDRALNHLKQAGLLKNVQGIVLGQFIAPNTTDTVESSAIAETIRVAIERFAREAQIPVFKNEQFGHGPRNYPIIYNAKSEISLETPDTFTWTMYL